MTPQVVELTRLDAPELAPFTSLTEAQLRNRRNAEMGLFIAESAKVILRALDAGCEAVSLLMERRQLESDAGRAVIARCPAARIYTADRALLEKLTGYALTRGFLCAMRRPQPQNADALLVNARRAVILENVTDPTNVGAILRSAAALGLDAALLTPDCCDPLHRRAARVSMGAVFQLPWARIGDWPNAGIAALHAQGFKLAALALRADAVSILDPRLAAEPRLALLLGSEGSGLRSESIALADYCVRIPMAHGVDSLNVAAAAAVAFWQLRAPEP